MAKRLYMTSADYLAIAISPALIMALVGSLVFFLIEVVYVGQYQARLNYAFALFVFAAVLIARISIEMGSERAALFALPLGIAMFLFLMRFVEHPSALSHLINLALLALVWWCAHRLTWDSTVIDDDEDASGEGLMQRIGVDGPAELEDQEKARGSVAAGAKENELLAAAETPSSQAPPWWQRLVAARSGPHTPGLWVLYFSLAALPLFGIGQHWIPAAEVGRRRYVFVLLVVYVAAALALLVTTSFLNLRRYLRQRHVEMPLPIAGTWVGVGAALIVVVMLLAALIPRPGAEIALSRVPWQAGSPGDLVASRTSVNRDGGEEQVSDDAESGESRANESQGKESPSSTEEVTNTDGDSGTEREDGDSSSADVESGNSQEGDRMGDGSESPQPRREESSTATDDPQSEAGDDSNDGSPEQQQAAEIAPPTAPEQTNGEPTEQPADNQGSSTPQSPPAVDAIQNVSSALGGLAGVLKIIFYVLAALLLTFLLWKYRHQILQALSDIMRQLRELLGGKRADTAVGDKSVAATPARPLRFSDFHDPFATGRHGQLAPEELVRYTFAAFEAWANDRGRVRTPDCTPQELLGMTLDPETPIYPKARQLVRLYGEVAYASRRITKESVSELRELWQMMRSMHARELS
jgi:hypothetical protein